ncbi:MAG TPA: acylneuraminate cytidylyltransferase family protein [Panacibacter sp.]|nr:acylneuraminate cytidylyltransferase family protein [Panacibacter sp.]HNP46527.1 acylneuraminate cytidylyltransferase family protein [Panacibacter sp.]
MFILGTICCRGGSKGIAGKNIKPLSGKPLLAYTTATALASSLLNDVIVSTDSEEIGQVARSNGINMVIDRPEALATDTASKWPVFIHAAEQYEELKGVCVDYLVDMDVTVPLKTTADIDGAIQTALANPAADVIITAYEPERNPYFNMMEIGGNGFASIVKAQPQPVVRRQDAPAVYSLCPAAYVIKRAALYAYDHWSKAKCMLYVIPRSHAVDIDTAFDFQLVEFLMQYEHGQPAF